MTNNTKVTFTLKYYQTETSTKWMYELVDRLFKTTDMRLVKNDDIFTIETNSNNIQNIELFDSAMEAISQTIREISTYSYIDTAIAITSKYIIIHNTHPELDTLDAVQYCGILPTVREMYERSDTYLLLRLQ